VFQKAVSQIWDIVQSVDRRAGMPLPHRRAGVSSRRELVFVGGSDSVPEQDKHEPSPHSASDSADGREQTHRVSVSDATCPHSTESADVCDNDGEQQQTGGLPDQERDTEKAASTANATSSDSPAAGKQAAENRRAKKKVQIQQDIATSDSVTSSGTKENVSTDESTVALGGVSPDTAENGLSKDG